MSFLVTIKSLYLLNGFIAVLLYLPQIVKGVKNREHARSLSLITFGGWSVGSVISTLYAWLLVQDRVFAAVSFGNFVGSGAIFCVAAGSRFAARKRVVKTPPARHS